MPWEDMVHARVSRAQYERAERETGGLMGMSGQSERPMVPENGRGSW